LEDKKGLFPQRSDSHRYTGEGGKTKIKYLFSNDSSDKIVVREYLERKLFCFSRVLCLLSHHLQDLLTSVRAVLRLKRIRSQIKLTIKKCSACNYFTDEAKKVQHKVQKTKKLTELHTKFESIFFYSKPQVFEK
jgi:hypothetical protein